MILTTDKLGNSIEIDDIVCGFHEGIAGANPNGLMVGIIVERKDWNERINMFKVQSLFSTANALFSSQEMELLPRDKKKLEERLCLLKLEGYVFL